MKTPPFLLLAALLFWGWQADFLLPGAMMGVILESARFTKFRWDLDDADFSRIWGFCSSLNIALIVFAFTNNQAGGWNGLVHGKTVVEVANSSAITATRFLRWLPMTTFAFIAAQAFNVRESVPLTGISLVLRWRRSKGDEAFTGRYLNVSYPFFLLCVFAAGIHSNAGTKTYFWGQLLLLVWALWTLRPARHAVWIWITALVIVLGMSFSEMAVVSQAQTALQSFNAQWMARFFGNRTDPLQSTTSMGRIGELKMSAKIVIWLRPDRIGRAPSYLREASYRNYQAQKAAWYAGTPSEFELLRSESDNTTWNLLPNKKPTDSVNIACYINGWSRELEAPEGLLPLPSGCSRLENVPANMALRENKNGAVLAAGRGLVIFDAHYGPGATIDSPPDVVSTNQSDLKIPTNEIPALESVIAELDLPVGADDAQKRLAVEKFFFDKFSYSTWQGPEMRNTKVATPLTTFLITNRHGHCEYFACATVLLLRELGIPARYAVGYYVHETRGGGFIVRERDAHAWCLVWNKESQCWEDFDTTPPSWVSIEAKRTRLSEWIADATSWLKFQFTKFRWGQANVQQYIFWMLIPVMLVLLYHIIFRRRGKLRAEKEKKEMAKIIWPGLDSEFYRLEQKLAARGLPRQPGEPLSSWLERAIADSSMTELRAPLRELLHLHYRHRFDPRGLSSMEREEMKSKAVDALAKISSASTSR